MSRAVSSNRLGRKASGDSRAPQKWALLAAKVTERDCARHGVQSRIVARAVHAQWKLEYTETGGALALLT